MTEQTRAQRIAEALAHEDALNCGYDHGFASTYGQDPETDGIVDVVLDVLKPELDALAALRQVARGYCPACGRGDAAPTVDDWERERQRADEAEAQLRLIDAMRQQNLDAAAAAAHRAHQAEAAVARVQALADQYPAGIDTAHIHAALGTAQHTPAAGGEQPDAG